MLIFLMLSHHFIDYSVIFFSNFSIFLEFLSGLTIPLNYCFLVTHLGLLTLEDLPNKINFPLFLKITYNFVNNFPLIYNLLNGRNRI
jgi:hypothetical protein